MKQGRTGQGLFEVPTYGVPSTTWLCFLLLSISQYCCSFNHQAWVRDADDTCGCYIRYRCGTGSWCLDLGRIGASLLKEHPEE